MKKFHPDANRLLKRILDRPPLIILAGEVGSGKSKLAETIGDSVARQENIDVYLGALTIFVGVVLIITIRDFRRTYMADELCNAIYNEDVALVETLLARGIDPTWRNSNLDSRLQNKR